MTVATEVESKTLYNVTEAAEHLGVTTGRVRQILISEHNKKSELATKVGRDWTVTPRQLKRLRKKHRELYQKKYGRFPDEA
jgi:hypothetical protein